MRVLRRMLHWSKVALLSVLALFGVLLALVAIATQLPAAREQLQGAVNDALSNALDARFEIERIDALSIFYVQTGPASLLDRQGRRVASLQSLRAQLDPFALLAGRVHVTHASIEGAYVDLGAPLDEGGGLLAVFARDASEPPSEVRDDGNGLRIVLSDVRLTNASVEARLQGARYQARDLWARAALDIGDAIDVKIDTASSRVWRDDAFAVALRGARLVRLGSGETHARVELVSGPAQLDAKLDLGAPRDHLQALEANLSVSRLSSAQLAPFGAGELGLDGPLTLRATARATSSEAFDVMDFRVSVNDASYAEVALPGVFGRGRFESSAGVRVDELLAAYGESTRMHASGALSNDGSLAVSAVLRSRSLAQVPALKAWLPGLSGQLDARVEARKSASDLWNASASLHASRAGYAALKLQALTLDATLRGALAAPKLDATLRAVGVTAPQLQIPQLALSASGDGHHYAARASLGARGGLYVQAERTGARWDVNGDAVIALQPGDWLRAGVAALHYEPEQPILLQNVHASYRGARARLDGALSISGDSRLRARLTVPSISALAAGWASVPVEGTLTLNASLVGRLARPKLSLDAHYACAQLQGLRDVVAQLSASADVPRRSLELELDVTARHASAHLSSKSVWQGRALALAALERARHDVVLKIERLPLAQLSAWPRDRLHTTVADLSAELELHGTLRDPSVKAHTTTRLQLSDDPEAITLVLSAEYAQEHIALKLSAADRHGEVLRSSLSTDLARSTFSSPRDGVLELLTERAWDASLWLGARRVDELPAVRALGIDPGVWPATVSGELSFSHRPDQEPDGELHMQAVWPPPAAHSPAPRCGQDHEPQLSVVASMHEGQLKSQLHARIAGADVLALSTASHAPIGEWLRPKQARPINISARLSQLQLGDVPVVCETMAGRVSGTASLDRALTQAVTAQADLRGTQMQWGKSAAFEASVSAQADDKLLVARAELTTGGGSAVVNGKLPIDAGGRMPSVRMDVPADASIVLRRVDVRALLGAVPTLSARSGTLDGDLRMTGSLDAPSLRGNLVLDDVSIVLPELGQPFEHVNGKLSLDGNTLQLARTRVHDRDGWVDISGEMRMQSLDTWRAVAKLHANNFPVRRSGVILARVDSNAELKVGLSPGRTQLEIAMRKTRIELTGADLGEIQALDPNPDIVLVQDGQVDAKEQDDKGPPSTLVIDIDASEPLWIRREDFSAQLRTKLRVESNQEGPSVSGEVNIDRGFVELMGQSFDIEHGNIRFQGGHEIEPVLDLLASRTPPGGKKVSIEAQGQLDKPTLRFLIDDAPVTAGEALAAATGTRSSDESGASVQNEIGSMATGIAAGVLTLGARRELGEWVPVLAYEDSDGESRLRAGVGAQRFIPRFLRKLVVDAYVEGILTREQKDAHDSSTAGADTGAGVLLELRFPGNFVTETQYGPGTRWSADLSWEP